METVDDARGDDGLVWARVWQLPRTGGALAWEPSSTECSHGRLYPHSGNPETPLRQEELTKEGGNRTTRRLYKRQSENFARHKRSGISNVTYRIKERIEIYQIYYKRYRKRERERILNINQLYIHFL